MIALLCLSVPAQASAESLLDLIIPPILKSQHDRPHWRAPVRLDSTAIIGSAESPKVAVDQAGNAIAVWHHWDGLGSTRIWASRYEAGKGWGIAECIESNADEAVLPDVGLDAAGNAVVVWWQFDYDNPKPQSIWANRYTVGSGWGTPERISDNIVMQKYPPKVVVNPSGDAVAVWKQGGEDGAGLMWTNRYAAGSGWGVAQLIGSAYGEVGHPEVGIDSVGNAIAIWNGSIIADEVPHIWSSRYEVGTGWGEAQPIFSGFGIDPKITMNAAGDAVVVWNMHDGILWHIAARHYISGIGWSAAQYVEFNTVDDAGGPSVGIDSVGNAVAVWQQFNGPFNPDFPTGVDIWANRYVAGNGWGTPQLIETSGNGVQLAQVAVNAAGNAFSVWEQGDASEDGYSSIWANRYVVGSGWRTAQLIETDNAGNAYNPEIVVDSIGKATAVWMQNDGTHWTISAARFE